MDVSIITQDGVLRESCEAIQLQHTESNGTLYAQLPGSVQLEAGDCIGFMCVDGRYRLFEISSRDLREPDGVWEANGVDKAICELMDEPVTDIRARDTTISAYLTRVLALTRFTIGQAGVNPTGSTTAYYETVWSAMAKAMEAYDVRLVPYYVLTGGRITSRLVDIISTKAEYRGRIFELGDDLTGISVSYDDSQIKTALYGRGQGVQIDGGDDSADPSYGRRLTFADVVWTKAGGDPADKPAGQEWIGDPDALAAYGRDGRHRFGFVTFDDETDAGALLTKTWEYLQQIKDPIISVTGTVQDTARMFGHGHEGVAIYDGVLVRISRIVDGSKIKTDIRAQIVDVVRDYVQPEETKLTIGNAVITAGTLVRRLSDTIDSYRSRAAIWDRANAFDLDGVMDVMNNQIISTTGHWYTDPDSGAIMLVSSDGTMAMRLTGAGWQISAGKVGGKWVWRTAATGAGIVADTITAGVLQAQLVKILGTDQFYWDSNAISIIHPTNANKIIKIGQYDGVNYGIGFSSDGGRTWNQSMNFDGVIATDIGALKIRTNQITGNIQKTEVTGQTAWKIDFDTGTMTIGAISADSIKAGTLSADRIGGHSLGVGKLSGSIANGSWGIDFTAGTMSIGTLAVGSITGNIQKTEVTGQTAWKIDFDTGTMTIGAISADSIKAGTLSADRIGAGSITLAKLKSSASGGDGIVSLDNAGLSISHSGIGTGSKTTLKADGLKVYDASGNLIGGLYKPTGQSVTKMGAGALFNPSYTNFSVQLEQYYSGESMTYCYGMALYRQNKRICGLGCVDSDSVSDGMLINYNDDMLSIATIFSTVKAWGGYDPSQFIRAGTSGNQYRYCNGSSSVDGSDKTHIDFPFTFSEIPSVCCTYSRTGGNQSGTIGPLKVYNKTESGFDIIIGGSATTKDFDWIAIGRASS